MKNRCLDEEKLNYSNRGHGFTRNIPNLSFRIACSLFFISNINFTSRHEWQNCLRNNSERIFLSLSSRFKFWQIILLI